MRVDLKTVLGVVLLGAILLPLATWAASLDEELTFIDRVPGLTLVNSRTTARHANNDYTIAGNPDSVFAQVRAAAHSRGWAIQDGSKTAYAGASTRVFRATKGDRRLQVSVNQAAGWTTLHAEVHARGTSPSSGDPGSPRQGKQGGSGGVIDVSASEAVTVNDSQLSVTYRMAGNQLTVNGSANRIVLTGSCTEVTVNGSNNSVDIQGSVRSIVTNGSNNRVTWSRSRNPNAPAVHDNAGSNRISPQ